MRDRDLERLEFLKLLERIGEFVHSKATERFIKNIRPIVDCEDLKVEMSLVSDFFAIEEGLSLYTFDDVEETIRKSGIKDYVLSVEEIISLLKVTKLIRDIRRVLGEYVSTYPNLHRLIRGLPLFSNLESVIESAIDMRGFVKDSASEDLREIRHRIRNTEKEVMRRLEGLLSRPDSSAIFSDKFVAFKNNRYVLPVKATEAKKVIGVVHGTSSSGFTIYIEPHNVVELNNQLVALRGEEEDEAKRILRRITAYVGEHASKLHEAFLTLLKVDYLKALARFSKLIDGRIIKIGNNVDLKGVKHPLLMLIKDEVTPIDLVISEKRGLLLTGPNTGGKTLALKTLGIVCLMFQCAMPVPANGDSSLPVFENIFTDIGDEQSMEQNLSTFSAHLSNIGEFLPWLNQRTLVLIDELGAGTDPVEGSALGIGLLEYFKRSNAYVFAITHHTPVKLYALGSDYYTPASVSFDRETLRPLYVIHYNVIGESMAFEVAKRHGLPQDLLETSQRYLPVGTLEYIAAKENLESCIKDYQEKLKDVEKMKLELQQRKAEQDRVLYELEKQKKDIWSKAMKDALDYLEELKKEGEELLKSAKERQRLRNFVQEKKKEVMAMMKKEEIRVGDWVEFMGSKGRVIEIKKEKACVVFGGAKAWTPLSELKRSEPPTRGTEEDVVASFEIRRGIVSEINLIGLSVDEALRKLELFLEEASKLSVKSVKVVHGHGSIKKALEDFLRNSDLVLFHREGYPKEGGSGTSILYLRKN
ncbi:MAG: endonuclease MutS2 [Aquificaceae bacterium]